MPDAEFKKTVIRIITGLEKRMKDIREMLTTDIKELKKMKNVITEIQNRLDVMTARIEEAGQ